ncbi:major facilitator superfamily transporter protein [Rutstroemia sp. NJR-2017a BBW]|nr:major facilitator superfamily transporter protein [Rutstroemia sp. NJR-2017a BBW]
MSDRKPEPVIRNTPPPVPAHSGGDSQNDNEGKYAGESNTSTTTSNGEDGQKARFSTLRENAFMRSCWKVLTWMPKRCRYDPESPPQFSMMLNLLFAFACTFTVANLYYSHPILNILADEFNVTNERASIIPTVSQAGYASGLLFLCPLGDIFKRRPFVLILVFFTATMWLGLCLTNSFSVFVGISFITALTTVTPQLMLPLVGELAPPHRRATCLAIVSSGLSLGLLIARLLSGILTQYTDWRTIYWFSFGVQYLILLLLYLFMPDYPRTNPGDFNYFRMLFSIIQLLYRNPILIQASLTGFCTSTIFTTYWTTLTFLLSSPPYNLSPTPIGLFALIGIATFLAGPIYSRYVIDKFVPLFSVILGLIYCLIGVLVGTFLGLHSLAGPILQAFFMDLGIQTAQIANRSAIYSIAPKARNRTNTAYMVMVFCGQLTGTAAGNRVYALGGWERSGEMSIGFVGAGLLLCFWRGPWEEGWWGWGGGWGLRRRDLGARGLEKKEDLAVERVLSEVAADEGSAEEGMEEGEKSSVKKESGDKKEEVNMKEVGEKSNAGPQATRSEGLNDTVETDEKKET